jgi:hypothetical protein
LVQNNFHEKNCTRLCPVYNSSEWIQPVLHLFSYTYSPLTQPYNNITNATVISPVGWDYLTVDTVPFPFQFKYYGMNFDTFYLAGGLGGFEYFGGGYFGNYELLFYDAPIFDRGFGISPISYSITGTQPNRIVKVQIENGGFIYDANETDFFDVQVWFYETTNVIEMHYGPNSVSNPDSWYQGYDGPSVALVRDTITYLALFGPALNPTPSTTTSTYYVTGSPPLGTVYRFTPLNNLIEEPPVFFQKIYPNPSTGTFTLDAKFLNSDGQLLIYDAAGQLIVNRTIGPFENTITIDRSGIYFLKLSGVGGHLFQKIIIY